VRHVVLGVTVAVYMITYMDRALMSTALPAIRQDLGISLIVASGFLSAFRWAYAIFQIPGAWLGDRIGPRKALTLIVGWWSAFTALTGLAWNASVMWATQFLFGMGEASAFPIATRSLSRWMLPRERGYAQGVTHAGSRLGAAFTRPLAAALIVSFGWRFPFFAFAALGLLWAVLWFTYYRDTPDEHKGVNAAERELIHSAIGPRRAAGAGKVPWKQILSSPTMQWLCIMYVCYQYGLAVYLDWFPTYLKEQRGFTLTQMGWYSSLPLLAGVVGNLGGGWVTDLLFHRTGNVKSARRIVGVGGFLLAGASIIPATLTADPRLCVAFSCCAFGFLEMTIGASWAVPLDIAGDYAGSAAALMNTCGNLGGAVSPTVIAYLVTAFGWNVPFMVGVGMNVLAALIYLRIDASRKIAGI
jgi:MFS family permease